MIEVILTEVSLVEYNNGAPLIASVLGELSRMGFVLYDIRGRASRERPPAPN
jgi:hypothetical protein